MNRIDETKLAPLVVFAFNRPDLLRVTLDALAKNLLADKTDLFIFVDGPRNESDIPKIEQVKEVAAKTAGFKTISQSFAEQNKGLAKSIISGTTSVIGQYGKVIVVEDDLYTSPSFLVYMNEMLQTFENDKRIFQVSGYSTKGCIPEGYDNPCYLSIRAHSWSWGTWKDRWETVDWDVKDFEQLKASRARQNAFNKGGSDLYGMLKGYMEGKNNSWYIRFNYEMHKQGRYSVCPLRSLVRNDGFVPESTHCHTYNRYKIEFDDKLYSSFGVKLPLNVNKRLNRSVLKYWSIPYRAYGKVMSLFYK